MAEDPRDGGAAGAGAPVEPAADYDRMVDWDKRLAREAPFFRERFAEAGVRRVADVGCGSGKHAIEFASWGLEVLGIDPDESMLAQARANAERAGAEVRFERGGFGEAAGLAGEPVDALVCLGNALPHVEGLEGLRRALADFAAALRSDGLLVLHLLNHERLVSKRIRTLPTVFRETPDGDRLFAKVLDYDEGGILFDFVTLTRAPSGPEGWERGDWELRSRRSRHTALPVSLLDAELRSAGFDRIVFHGDHTGRVLDASADESVIVSARRAG